MKVKSKQKDIKKERKLKIKKMKKIRKKAKYKEETQNSKVEKWVGECER